MTLEASNARRNRLSRWAIDNAVNNLMRRGWTLDELLTEYGIVAEQQDRHGADETRTLAALARHLTALMDGARALDQLPETNPNRRNQP